MYIVIPAYKPDEKLYGVIEGLVNTGSRFVIVDDGSGADYEPVFSHIEETFGELVTVLRHSENRGKGRAMKTAFEYICGIADPEDGLVTVDADGQHLPKDAVRVMDAWRAEPDSLVLGSRHFTGKVPFTSRWGNGFTRIVFAVTTGVRVWDTQTGLRAFAVKRIPEMLNIKGERYDYEMAQLLEATREGNIREVRIDTVYIEGNKSSHFRILKDSLLINKMIFLFIIMSFLSFLVDYFTVLISSRLLSSIPSAVQGSSAGTMLIPIFGILTDVHLIALILGRVLGSTCNFLLNKKLVFRSGDRWAPLRFIIIKALLLLLNYALLSLVMSGTSPAPLWLAQLIVSAVLYPVSFVLQRMFVFRNKKSKKKKAQ